MKRQYEVIPFPGDEEHLCESIASYVEEGWVPLSITHTGSLGLPWTVLFKRPEPDA